MCTHVLNTGSGAHGHAATVGQDTPERSSEQTNCHQTPTAAAEHHNVRSRNSESASATTRSSHVWYSSRSREDNVDQVPGEDREREKDDDLLSCPFT